jgi:phosphoribosyl 1,2-cyclic phosphodiesterase
MTLELCVLASGSAGNASIVRAPSGVLLIDAGIGPRTFADRLVGTGVRLDDIAALCLTHLDGDHFSPAWTSTLLRLDVPIYCHVDKAGGLSARAPDLVHLIRPFDGATFAPIAGVTCEAVRFAHDTLGSHGFVIDGFDYRIGYATDLGHVPRAFFDCFRDLDSIALESNYDPQMQAESSRPLFLKQRIMGARGHLSNIQALAALRKLLDRARRLPDHIVLLHRSQECNCPRSRTPSNRPRQRVSLVLGLWGVSSIVASSKPSVALWARLPVVASSDPAQRLVAPTLAALPHL